MHCDEFFTPSCEATFWSGCSRVCAGTDALGPLGDHQCSLVLSLHLSLPVCPAHTDTSHWKISGKGQETKSVRDSPLSHRLLGSQTQCSDQVLFSKALFSFRATPPSLLCLWFTQDPLWTWKIASLHVSLCVCLQPRCYHPENDVKSSFFSSWSG